jgi:hypothetical protein
MHVATAVAFNEVPLTVHPVSVPAKVTAPSPDPPDVTNVIAVPAVPVSVVFDTVSVAWTVTGVTGDDALDVAVPPAFVAAAVNVYAVPFFRPVTSHDPDSPVTVHVPPVTAGDAVTVYDAGVPPVVAAATVTVTLASPAVTVEMVGTPGATTASTAPETVSDVGDVYVHPSAVVPVTMNVLFAFFVRPRNWMDPLDSEVLSVALWPVFAVAVNR